MTTRAVSVERTSALAAPADEVWVTATTMEGVNAELVPLVRMTHPRGLRSLRELDPPVVAGRVLFRSWLLAGGIVPFDRHALALDEVDDAGRRFVEESTSWLQRRWRHERSVVARPGGCVVTDRLTVEPRLGPARPLVAAAVGRIFDHRHRRLRRRYGALSR